MPDCSPIFDSKCFLFHERLRESVFSSLGSVWPSSSFRSDTGAEFVLSPGFFS